VKDTLLSAAAAWRQVLETRENSILASLKVSYSSGILLAMLFVLLHLPRLSTLPTIHFSDEQLPQSSHQLLSQLLLQFLLDGFFQLLLQLFLVL
jgi:hypothetical protein